MKNPYTIEGDIHYNRKTAVIISGSLNNSSSLYLASLDILTQIQSRAFSAPFSTYLSVIWFQRGGAKFTQFHLKFRLKPF